MSSQALASNNPSRSSSEKERALVCRKEIAELIQRADFSQETEALVRKNVDGKLQLVPCRRTYRRRHLNRALLGVWEGSDRPYGKNEIRCFAHLDKYATHAHACERTMRYNLRVLDDSDPENGLGILEEKAKANSIRRPTTYELNVEKLRHFTVLPFRRKNPNSTPRRKAAHSSSPPEAPPSVQPAARPQPSPAAPARESQHKRMTVRPLRSGQQQDLGAMYQRMLVLMEKYPPPEQALDRMAAKYLELNERFERKHQRLDWRGCLGMALREDCPHLPVDAIQRRFERISQEIRGHGLKDEETQYIAQRPPLEVPRTKKQAVEFVCLALSIRVDQALEHLRESGHEIPEEESP